MVCCIELKCRSCRASDNISSSAQKLEFSHTVAGEEASSAALIKNSSPHLGRQTSVQLFLDVMSEEQSADEGAAAPAEPVGKVRSGAHGQSPRFAPASPGVLRSDWSPKGSAQRDSSSSPRKSFLKSPRATPRSAAEDSTINVGRDVRNSLRAQVESDRGCLAQRRRTTQHSADPPDATIVKYRYAGTQTRPM